VAPSPRVQRTRATTQRGDARLEPIREEEPSEEAGEEVILALKPFISLFDMGRSKIPAFNISSFQKDKQFFSMNNPYHKDRTASSRRFWSIEQQIYYLQVLCNKYCLFHHQCINLAEMQKLRCFNQVLESIDVVGLMNVVNFHQYLNEELVLQFYATLFVSGDPKDSNHLGTGVDESVYPLQSICLNFDSAHLFSSPCANSR
jgi:hypothetical protein